jgi:hypothetical protein
MSDDIKKTNPPQQNDPVVTAGELTPDEIAFLELLKKDLKLQEDLKSMHYETLLAKFPAILPNST